MTSLEFLAVAVTQGVVLLVALIGARRAGQARELSGPTGNGFAARVERKLDELADDMSTVSDVCLDNRRRLDELDGPGLSSLVKLRRVARRRQQHQHR